MKEKPNLLILDEPTNDLDIVTLNILEEYLKEFSGTLIIVSHDRHFLDRLVDHLFVFCGDGAVKDFIGSYSEYRSFIKDYEAGQKKVKKSAGDNERKDAAKPERQKKPKLTYKEQKELEQLEKDMHSLAEEKAGLEKQINSGTLSYEQLQKVSERIGEIISLNEEKEMMWLELSLKTEG